MCIARSIYRHEWSSYLDFAFVFLSFFWGVLRLIVPIVCVTGYLLSVFIIAGLIVVRRSVLLCFHDERVDSTYIGVPYAYIKQQEEAKSYLSSGYTTGPFGEKRGWLFSLVL